MCKVEVDIVPWFKRAGQFSEPYKKAILHIFPLLRSGKSREWLFAQAEAVKTRLGNI